MPTTNIYIYIYIYTIYIYIYIYIHYIYIYIYITILTQCISVWYSNTTNQDCKALQRVVRLAERISGSALPSLQDIYLKRCKSRAVKIIKDSNHPGNHLFILLPSGKHFRSMMAKTERLTRRFFPQAIQVLQSAVWTMGRVDTWGGTTHVAPPTPNSIRLYGKSYWCRPKHVHSFVYDFVKLIWPYYRNIMC